MGLRWRVTGYTCIKSILELLKNLAPKFAWGRTFKGFYQLG